MESYLIANRDQVGGSEYTCIALSTTAGLPCEVIWVSALCLLTHIQSKSHPFFDHHDPCSRTWVRFKHSCICVMILLDHDLLPPFLKLNINKISYLI